MGVEEEVQSPVSARIWKVVNLVKMEVVMDEKHFRQWNLKNNNFTEIFSKTQDKNRRIQKIFLYKEEKVYSLFFKVTCLITYLVLYWPKFIEFLLISCYFGIGTLSSFFIWLKISLLDVKMRKKKEKQTFRPHMGALFSAINSKINSKFL